MPALDREPLPDAISARAPALVRLRPGRCRVLWRCGGAAMMMHPLLPKLRELDLSGMVLTLDVRAAQATESHLTPRSSWPSCSTMSWSGAANSAWRGALPNRAVMSRRPWPPSTLPPHPVSIAASDPGSGHLRFRGAPREYPAVWADRCRQEPSGQRPGLRSLKRDYRVLSRSLHRLLADLHAARATGAYNRLWAKGGDL